MNNPWVVIQEGQEALGPPVLRYSAVFALKVQPKEFETIKGWKWGFAPKASLDEGVLRLVEFIRGIHHYDFLEERIPDNRALALRYYLAPTTQRLVILLVAKISGATRQEAESRARAFYYQILATAPYEYDYIPITQEEEFNNLTQNDLIINAKDTVEIHRFEAPLQIEEDTLYALGKWNFTLWSNEKVWRLLSGYPQTILVNILLKPVSISFEERDALRSIAKQVNQISGDDPDALTHFQADWLAELYHNRLSDWRFPYIVQVHLLSAQQIPDIIVQTIGSSFNSTESADNASVSGFRFLHLNGFSELGQRITRLEPSYRTDQLPSPAHIRLRYMFDAQEAAAPFRLPFPPEAGLPGVAFE